MRKVALIFVSLVFIPYAFGFPIKEGEADNPDLKAENKFSWVKHRDSLSKYDKKVKDLFVTLKKKIRSCADVELAKRIKRCAGYKKDAKSLRSVSKVCIKIKKIESQIECEKRWIRKLPVKYRPLWLEANSKKRKRRLEKLEALKKAKQRKKETPSRQPEQWLKEY